MEVNISTATALSAMYFRAFHSERDAPKIVDDWLAHYLLTAEDRTLIEQGLPPLLKLLDPGRAASCPDQATALALVVRHHLAAPILTRTRYVEDQLLPAIQRGIRQYVILGAGFDTFAYRRPDLLENLQVFELDHPATVELKRSRISLAGWGQPAQLHFVPVDLAMQDLAAALLGASYDPQLPTLFSWLGLSYYQTSEKVLSTLGMLAGIGPAGSLVVFDYYDPDAYDPQKVSKRLQTVMEVLRQAGQPPLSSLDPSTLAKELAPLNLRVTENLAPSDIEERYFQGRTDGLHAYEHIHIACAEVIG